MEIQTPRSTIIANSHLKVRLSHALGSSSWFVGLSPVLVFAFMVVLLWLTVPQIFSAGGLRSYAVNAAPVMMLVLACTFPILMGGIDLSVAAMATFAGVLIALLSPTLGPLTVPVVLAIATAIGAAHGRLRVFLQLPSFISSLGLLGLLTGSALVWSRATAMPIDPRVAFLKDIGGETFGIPNVVVVIAACALLLVFIARFMILGRTIYAIGSNERATLMSGVNVSRVYTAVYAISALYAALAGCMLASQTFYSAPGFAANLLLPAIVGVVIGGTAISGGIGGVWQSLLGGLTASFFQTGAILLGFPPAIQNMAFGAIIIVAVAINIDRGKFGVVK
ncbi:ABC transporter permease [Mesorhizobium sp. M3A.F.Ca.ET.201.01.1.1]|uniref:ABC transporter permease n=1 Tax=Mesorhizobium sp. M3A.F.Ca.ET.201.01.1.1 TaxID=2563946 RepID=UPI001093A015|nr:ABC transporter permease [Mesorhizobium sp. M3A.F.Ca.ET.201.01.1.1]TGS71710.1 ABC transporter permease [Mesorhizobium sp. M3A.F.Ca.ET.201.01.1.1]